MSLLLLQVLTMNLRSAALAGQPLPPPESELDYPSIINRALPDDIRVLGWTDVPNPDFDARCACAVIVATFCSSSIAVPIGWKVRNPCLMGRWRLAVLQPHHSLVTPSAALQPVTSISMKLQPVYTVASAIRPIPPSFHRFS